MSSEYGKIETLYERDPETRLLKPELILKNPVYGLLKTWDFTEKIDGNNIRVIWDHVTATITVGGRTDNAQLPTDLVAHIYQSVPAAQMLTVFPDADAVIYGEGYGAGIRKGVDYSPTKAFIVFDALVDGKWWLSRMNIRDVATKLGLDVVPSFGTMTLEAATEMVRAGFPSKLNGGKKRAEGLVGRPAETLFDKRGHRLIVKLKTRDF